MAENNLHACRPYVGTVLTDRHRRERPQWADRHITGQGKIGGRFFFQMNPGLHCPIVMVGSGSTDVGMNVTLTCVLQRDQFWLRGFRDGTGPE